MTAGTIALAGGSGFVGAHVAAELIAAGHRVVIVDRGARELPAALGGVERRRCDLTIGPIDASVFEGCAVVVNLVGIKRQRTGQSFEQVHVELVRNLRTAALQAGVPRLIHVSVAGAVRATDSPYLDSKARAEELLHEPVEGIAITIVRPGVIHGRGDDFVRNLADSIRAAPVFPAPHPSGPLEPIAAIDVATAIRRCIERPETAGRDYDLVGPERIALSTVIDRVAEGVGRPCRILRLPLALLRPAARLFEAVSRDPLITVSQLQLLSRGVVGDPEPARRDLDFEPRRLDADAIAAALADFRPRLPSIRLVPDRAAMRELAEFGGGASWSRLGLFGVLAVASLLAGPWLIPGSPWIRMTVLEALLALVAFVTLPLGWMRAWAPSLPRFALGLGLGSALWLAALGVTGLIAWLSPSLWSGVDELYGWAHELEFLVAFPLLVIVVAGEEVVWRGALGLALAAKAIEHRRVLLAVGISAGLFTLAHLTMASPLLWLAAALAGATWTAIAIRTRSLWVTFVCHLGWDAALLWLTPLG